MLERVRRNVEKSAKLRASEQLVFSRELINDCVRYAAPLDIVYLNNPKCACTTVKHALWLASDSVRGRCTFKGNVHDRKIDPFARNVFRLSAGQKEGIRRAVVFSVVRNPFARALSAYLDKVANDPFVWPVFLRRFGLRPEVGRNELSFADFISLIAVAHDDILDGHFRPQCRNLVLPLAQPVFVGCVEDMAKVGKFLAQRGIAFRDERMNATKATENIGKFYDSRTTALVRERYAEDFAAFGYSRELSDVTSRPRPRLPSAGRGEDRLLRWLRTGKPPTGVTTEPRSPFVAFNRSKSPQEKLRIVRRCDFGAEHNWYRLGRYLDFVARKSRDGELAQAIRERMGFLRQLYSGAVSNTSIFAEFPA